MWVLHFDGLFEPRFTERGIATYGWQAARDGRVEGEGKGLLLGPGQGGSANVAEFGALIHGLTWLRDTRRDHEPILVRGDSRLVVETVAGRWKLESERLIPLRDMARAIAKDLGDVRFEKVSREANAQADRLSREAYHEAADANPTWGLGKWKKSR